MKVQSPERNPKNQQKMHVYFWNGNNNLENIKIPEDRQMEMNTEDYLKKALLDTQERVRDFMNYSDKLKDDELKQFFRQYAVTEGEQASRLQQYIKSLKQ